MKKQAFLKWVWTKGQLMLRGQLWPKGSLRFWLHFDVSTFYQLVLLFLRARQTLFYDAFVERQKDKRIRVVD